MPMRYWEQCPKRSLVRLTRKGIRRRLSNNVFSAFTFSCQRIAVIRIAGNSGLSITGVTALLSLTAGFSTSRKKW